MKTILPQLLPDDINVEQLLTYYPEGTCKVSFSGLHKRNAYNDIVDMEPLNSESIHLTLSRNSLYNALPEYMFHPIDRFDNLPSAEEKELFAKELEEQTEEIEHAYKFFAPIDLLLLHLKAQVRTKLGAYAKEDVIMQQIIGDTLTSQQRNNRFIQALIPFLPQCRQIRGNMTLITLMLRKIFLDEGLHIHRKMDTRLHTEEAPRYEDRLDMEVGEGFVAGGYHDPVITYVIHYWDQQECTQHLFQLQEEVEQLRQFIAAYFLSVEQELQFDISHDAPPMQLNDSNTSHYLNYNINL